jgi:hypothetical protein
VTDQVGEGKIRPRRAGDGVTTGCSIPTAGTGFRVGLLHAQKLLVAGRLTHDPGLMADFSNPATRHFLTALVPGPRLRSKLPPRHWSSAN